MGELVIPEIVEKTLSNTGYYEGENIGFVAKEGTRCSGIVEVVLDDKK